MIGDGDCGEIGGMKIGKGFFLLVGWDFGYCGHYWPIVQVRMIGDGDCGELVE
jgi:hypothetical protein